MAALLGPKLATPLRLAIQGLPTQIVYQFKGNVVFPITVRRRGSINYLLICQAVNSVISCLSRYTV